MSNAPTAEVNISLPGNISFYYQPRKVIFIQLWLYTCSVSGEPLHGAGQTCSM